MGLNQAELSSIRLPAALQLEWARVLMPSCHCRSPSEPDVLKVGFCQTDVGAPQRLRLRHLEMLVRHRTGDYGNALIEIAISVSLLPYEHTQVEHLRTFAHPS